ncbi:fructoselysine 3-epimerase [Ruminococcaceae bacterium OttesenSCG-928-D13]|nr:fructoselysine 3-epimerase [Ruminococcaceae bacterium OttesenSCG-928-D13]
MMEIGMFTSGYQRYPLARVFEDAARLGYDYIELWGGRPHAYPPDLAAGDLGAVLELVERHGVPVGVYTPEHNAYPFNYMLGSERQRREALDYLKTAIEMGKALGAEYTLISAGHAGNTATPAEIRARLVDSLRELAAHAEKTGHQLLLETLTVYESNHCTTAGELAEVLDAVNSPCLFGMCDVVVPFTTGEPALDYLDKLGGRMRHLHLVDSDGASDAHLVPGEGRYPLAELLVELSQRGYTGRATIELVTAYMNEPTLYARRALEQLRRMMPQTGAKGGAANDA